MKTQINMTEVLLEPNKSAPEHWHELTFVFDGAAHVMIHYMTEEHLEELVTFVNEYLDKLKDEK